MRAVCKRNVRGFLSAKGHCVVQKLQPNTIGITPEPGRAQLNGEHRPNKYVDEPVPPSWPINRCYARNNVVTNEANKENSMNTSVARYTVPRRSMRFLRF